MVTQRDVEGDEALLSLSDLVDATGVPASTIHHYLKCELIPPPIRSALNRFRYDERHVVTLRHAPGPPKVASGEVLGW